MPHSPSQARMLGSGQVIARKCGLAGELELTLHDEQEAARHKGRGLLWTEGTAYTKSPERRQRGGGWGREGRSGHSRGCL